MQNNKKLDFELDILGVISLIATFASILVAFNLSISTLIIAVAVFLILLAFYIYLAIIKTITGQAEELRKINEKLNIYRDISDLRAKVDLLMPNKKMNKSGKTDFIEAIIRIIQVAAIIFAFYIILKALAVI